MLPAKSWKTEAVARLLASVFLCIYAGTLLAAALPLALEGQLGPKAATVSGTAALCLLGTLVLVRRSWPPERFMTWLGCTVALFYAGVFLAAWAQKLLGRVEASAAQMAIAALSFQGAAVWLVARFLREQGVGWNEGFGFRERWREALLTGILLACIFLPIGWALQWLSTEAITRFMPWKGEPAEQQAVQTLRMASGWLPRSVLGVVTIVLAPVAEEFLFRGVLFTWIRQWGYPKLALWGTSFLFALIHLNTATLLPLLVLALLLARLYERTGNLLAPIAAHALFNAFNFTMLYLLHRGGH
jgi:membrane protease YdiL (CAAX protease family)